MSKLRIATWEAKEGNTLSANGLIRTNPNKPEFGSIMLIQDSITVSNGFVNKRNKVGFLVGTIVALQAIVAEYKLKAGDDYSEKIGTPHKIVTLELLESEIPEGKTGLGYRQKINPTTGEVLTKNGEEIYWRRQVVAESSELTDTLIEHDRVAVDNSVHEFTGAAQKQTMGK